MESRKFGWRLALSDADLCAAYNLRYEVFVDEQGFGADRDLDRSVHLAHSVSMIQRLIFYSLTKTMAAYKVPCVFCPILFVQTALSYTTQNARIIHRLEVDARNPRWLHRLSRLKNCLLMVIPSCSLVRRLAAWQ